mmetsp:Transcript_4768/g.21577  ORF Transcript_4768/g.21577 Transcript_4768/m.21577 type:complete len:200 (-) Transcript_4768:362-961(-)
MHRNGSFSAGFFASPTPTRSTSSGGTASTTSAPLDSHASLAFARHRFTSSAVSSTRVWNKRSGLPNASVIAPINLGADSLSAGIPVSSTHSLRTESNNSRRTALGSIQVKSAADDVDAASTRPTSFGSGWPLGPLKTPRKVATPALRRRTTKFPSDVSRMVSTPRARLSCVCASAWFARPSARREARRAAGTPSALVPT